MGVEYEIITDEQRLRPDNSEVERLCSDNSKAKKLLGWVPEFGTKEGFCKGLQETIEWFKKPDNIKAYKIGKYNL